LSLACAFPRSWPVTRGSTGHLRGKAEASVNSSPELAGYPRVNRPVAGKSRGRRAAAAVSREAAPGTSTTRRKRLRQRPGVRMSAQLLERSESTGLRRQTWAVLAMLLVVAYCDQMSKAWAWRHAGRAKVNSGGNM